LRADVLLFRVQIKYIGGCEKCDETP
jgi:hypothetical protein